MMLAQNDAEAKRIIDAAFGCDLAAPFVGLLVMKGSEICGAVVLNNYEPGKMIELTAAGQFDARTLRELARYVFDRLKVRRVSAVTRQSNARAKSALYRMGFVREGVMRERFGDEDGVLFGLLRRDFPLRF